MVSRIKRQENLSIKDEKLWPLFIGRVPGCCLFLKANGTIGKVESSYLSYLLSRIKNPSTQDLRVVHLTAVKV